MNNGLKRGPYELTPNEHDWIVMEKYGFTVRETLLIFGLKPGSDRILHEAHAKLRSRAELQVILDKTGQRQHLNRAHNRIPGSLPTGLFGQRRG